MADSRKEQETQPDVASTQSPALGAGALLSYQQSSIDYQLLLVRGNLRQLRREQAFDRRKSFVES